MTTIWLIGRAEHSDRPPLFVPYGLPTGFLERLERAANYDPWHELYVRRST